MLYCSLSSEWEDKGRSYRSTVLALVDIIVPTKGQWLRQHWSACWSLPIG